MVIRQTGGLLFYVLLILWFAIEKRVGATGSLDKQASTEIHFLIERV